MIENNDILDQVENLNNTKNTKLAFRLFIFSITFLFVFAISRLVKINYGFIELFFGISLVVVFIANIIGFVFTIRSFIKREPTTVFKIVGGFGNFIFLLLNFVVWGIMALNYF